MELWGGESKMGEGRGYGMKGAGRGVMGKKLGGKWRCNLHCKGRGRGREAYDIYTL